MRSLIAATARAALLSLVFAGIGQTVSAQATLTGNITQIDVGAGGTLNMSLSAPAFPGNFYLVLGTTGGTSPGFPFGGVQVPLNPSAYFNLTLALSATFLQNQLNVLDGAGNGSASFTIPPGLDPMFAGITVSHAYVVFTPAQPGILQAASNPVDVLLVAPQPSVLTGNVATIDLGTGGALNMSLSSPSYPNFPYFVLGTTTGTSPGFVFDGLNIPLNPTGIYFQLTLGLAANFLTGQIGFLSGSGTGSAAFTVPAGLDPALAGTTVSHAFAVLTLGNLSNLQSVSNPLDVLLTLPGGPSVTSVNPSSGSSLGGFSATVNGSGFQAGNPGINTVSFGANNATSVVVINDSTLTCTVPAGTPGASVTVSVTNNNGTGALPNGFTYFPRPTLTQVSPGNGPAIGGTTVTLTGSGFLNNNAGTNTITFGGQQATMVNVISDTMLSCRTPSGTPGTSVAVVLSNANGSVTLNNGFSYNALPAVTNVTPGSGSSLGGTNVTISGNNFQANGAGTNTVTFGGQSATGVVVVNNTTITCLTPAGAPGSSVSVTVSNANGSATLNNGFTYNPLPTLTSVMPGSGPASGGTMVSLTGTGFQANGAGTNTVTFGGQPATNVVVVNNTTIMATTPAGGPGAVNVVVSNTNGSATLVNGFNYGGAVASADLNNDGISDLAIGAPEAASDNGNVRVFFGSAGPLFNEFATGADVTITSASADARLGTAIATGDVNGDGITDLVVGAPEHRVNNKKVGQFHVFYGPLASGAISSGSANVTIVGTASSDQGMLGRALAVVNVNGDTIADVLAGAPEADFTDDKQGGVYVFFGGSLASGTAASANVTLSGEAKDDELGTSVAGGDVNGDGIGDVITGAPRNDRNGGDSGTVYVFHGGSLASGSAAGANVILTGAAGSDRFGTSVAWGNVNGTGSGDVIAGAPQNDVGGGNSGAVYAFFSPLASGSAAGASRTWTGQSSSDEFGTVVATGDVNGDGIRDVLAGAPKNDAGGGDSGRIYVFAGGGGLASGSAGTATAIFTGEANGDRFGTNVRAVDYNGNGIPDLIGAAVENDAGGDKAGRVYVFFGTAVLMDRPASADDVTYTGSVAGDKFGTGLSD
jgi:hypothetical protein